MTDPWQERLVELLKGEHDTTSQPGAAGAELIVTDGEGQEVFRAPLARHHRFDKEAHDLVWVRPIAGGYAPVDPATESDYLFSLNTMRRRALHYQSARLEDGEVLLILHTGLTARITPAAGAARTHLWLWDEFCANELDSGETAALADLQEDSWHGPHA